ncbi:MAG: hypothetical protein RSD28_02730, partial [Lachnospiraceae bacterium]
MDEEEKLKITEQSTTQKETIDDTIETMEELIAETTELEPIPSSELTEIQRKTREDESGYTALKMSIA